MILWLRDFFERTDVCAWHPETRPNANTLEDLEDTENWCWNESWPKTDAVFCCSGVRTASAGKATSANRDSKLRGAFYLWPFWPCLCSMVSGNFPYFPRSQSSLNKFCLIFRERQSRCMAPVLAEADKEHLVLESNELSRRVQSVEERLQDAWLIQGNSCHQHSWIMTFMSIH